MVIIRQIVLFIALVIVGLAMFQAWPIWFRSMQEAIERDDEAHTFHCGYWDQHPTCSTFDGNV